MIWLVACGGFEPCAEGYGRVSSGACVPLDDGAVEPEDDTPVDSAPLVDSAEPPVELTPLSAPRLLRRLSLDLRGTLPSVEELDAVEADPTLVDAYREEYLYDAAFRGRVVQLLEERFHTTVDEYLILFEEYLLGSADEYTWERSIGEEPLQLMAWIADQDLPWSDIVTADYTVADEMLENIWPLEREDGDGWVVGRYTDGRPAAGILATNGLWFRYYTTVANKNRARAAAMSRLLLCEDYLNRPVSFGSAPSLADEGATEEALKTDPYCLGCHSSLDPIAATLFGFWTANEYNRHELDSYHPERELIGEELLDVEMSWYGEPLAGLQELGPAIAADERFARCAAETWTELLWRRTTDNDDWTTVDGLRQEFLADGTLRGLLRAVTSTEEYAAAGDGDVGRVVGRRQLTPALMSSSLGELSGLQWTWDGWDQLDNDTWGYRQLGGGVDGVSVTRAQDVPSLTWLLVVQRWGYAVGQTMAPDLAGSDVRAGLAELAWQLHAVRASDDELDLLEALFAAVQDEEGEEEAWAVALTVLVRDPEFVSY